MAAPLHVAEPKDPLLDQLRGLIDRAVSDTESARGDPSRSTIGKIDDDLREAQNLTARLEEARARDPVYQLAESLARFTDSRGGQPPIGRGGVFGIVLAVCFALLGSPILDRILPASGDAEVKRAAAAAVVDKRLDEIDERLEGMDRRFAAEQRTNAWVAEVLRKSLAATGQIAHKLEIQDVDLDMPVLWPE